MPNCPNCGREIQGGMRFCPNCGQDQSVVVPQDQRIPTEDVPVPPPSGSSRGGGRRKWVIGLLGCGGLVALLLAALLVVAVVSGPTNQTAQSGGGGQENSEESKEEKKKPEPKKKSGPDNVQASVGQTAELSDRTLVVNEIERNYAPPTRVPNLQPGNEFVRMFVTLTNTGNQTFDYNPNNFKVQDSNGVQQTPRNPPQLPYTFQHGSLAPNGILEGNMVFQVPQGDPGLSLQYEPFEQRSIGTITVTL